jgi:hypothetical protein
VDESQLHQSIPFQHEHQQCLFGRRVFISGLCFSFSFPSPIIEDMASIDDCVPVELTANPVTQAFLWTGDSWPVSSPSVQPSLSKRGPEEHERAILLSYKRPSLRISANNPLDLSRIRDQLYRPSRYRHPTSLGSRSIFSWSSASLLLLFRQIFQLRDTLSSRVGVLHV